MPVSPYPILATDPNEMLTQMQSLMDDLYQNRIGGANVGDVFQIGADDVLQLKYLSIGGLQKINGSLSVKPNTDLGLDSAADGLYVKLKADNGLAVDTNGLYVKLKTAGGISVDADGLALSAATTHNILSATHADAVGASAVVAGDIMIGNATPKWDKLAKGAEGKLVRAGAALPAYSTLTMPDTIAAGSVFAANSANVLAAINSTTGITYLKNTTGTVAWADAVTNTQVLYSDSGLYAGATNLTWNKTTNVLALASTAKLTMVGGVYTPGATTEFNVLSTSSTAVSATSEGLRTATWRMFDTHTDDVDNALLDLNIIQTSNPTSVQIRKTGIHVKIFTQPDNGADTSGILVNQTGGGCGIAVYKWPRLRPAGLFDYTSSVTVHAGSFIVGEQYVISVVGDTNFVAIGAASNTIGVRFIATGAGSGTGEAYVQGFVAALETGTTTDSAAIQALAGIEGAGLGNDYSQGMLVTMGATYAKGILIQPFWVATSDGDTRAAFEVGNFNQGAGNANLKFQLLMNGQITTGSWHATTIAVDHGGTGETSLASLKTSMSLNSVENTALSTWAGTTNITTLGSITTGGWHGTTIALDHGGTGQTTAANARTALGVGTGDSPSFAAVYSSGSGYYGNSSGVAFLTSTGTTVATITTSGTTINIGSTVYTLSVVTGVVNATAV